MSMLRFLAITLPRVLTDHKAPIRSPTTVAMHSSDNNSPLTGFSIPTNSNIPISTNPVTDGTSVQTSNTMSTTSSSPISRSVQPHFTGCATHPKPPSAKANSNTPLIIGTTVGSIAFIILGVISLLLYRRRKTRRSEGIHQIREEDDIQVDSAEEHESERMPTGPVTTQNREPRFRHHQDSGWRPRDVSPPPPSESGHSNLIHVPPEYESAV
ncbi:hypothetical protein VNI00_017302 [Paramarasmius palmivorus]|uniref:Uncharacterized protein n=1 Tax=Paramarasmius palmivorus TaxID=297713 RepID=A0AAW0B7J8_9AGAR